MTGETWLPIEGWEGRYEVSTHGRVRSVPRLDRLGRRLRGRVLQLVDQRIGRHRRQVVTLSDVPRRQMFCPRSYLARLDLESSKPAENRGNAATSPDPVAGGFGPQRKPSDA